MQNMDETSKNLQEIIEEENKIYGDMLQCNFTDTYRMLPEKVKMFCLITLYFKILYAQLKLLSFK